MTDDDIIRLAEAMGWKKLTGNSRSIGDYEYWVDPDGEDHGMTRFNGLPAFDPRTDANADYAVLEWARSFHGTGKRTWFNFMEELDDLYDGGLLHEYQIGDYARAALKVIDQ